MTSTAASTRRLAGIALLVAAGAATSRPLSAEERWYTLELMGERVGHARQESDLLTDGGVAVERTRIETRTELRRAAGAGVEKLVVTSREEWREDESGRPLTVESLQDGGGGAVTRVAGALTDSVLRLRVAGTGAERSLDVPWTADVLAPAALDRRLRSFLASGEPELAYRSFSLEALQVVDVQVKVVRRDAAGIELASTIPALGITTREVWSAEGGLVRQEMGPLVMREVSREEALADLPSTMAPFEALTLRVVGERRPRRGDLTARYTAIPRAGEAVPALAGLFPVDDQQRVVSENGREVLEVAMASVVRPAGPATVPVDAAYLAPSSLLESDDAELRRAALEAAGSGSVVERSRRLERWVHDHVRYLGSGVGFGSAVQTLRSGDGDCTEHAVLLAAMLRAVAVPSRLVVGVAWADNGAAGPAFVPHAWTEAWTGTIWLPLDAALYGPGIDATHLAMARSSGADSGGMLDLAGPLLRGLGRFDLELLAAESPSGRGVERR